MLLKRKAREISIIDYTMNKEFQLNKLKLRKLKNH